MLFIYRHYQIKKKIKKEKKTCFSGFLLMFTLNLCFKGVFIVLIKKSWQKWMDICLFIYI
jgi:hypothetical protein